MDPQGLPPANEEEETSLRDDTGITRRRDETEGGLGTQDLQLVEDYRFPCRDHDHEAPEAGEEPLDRVRDPADEADLQGNHGLHQSLIKL